MKLQHYYCGTVGSQIRSGTTSAGKPFASFRFAVNYDYFDTESQNYKEVDTSWFDVSVYGAAAMNIAQSVSQGDPLIVIGRTRIREWENEEKSGIAAEIIAEAVGHNLRFGTGEFTRAGKQNNSDSYYLESSAS